MSSNELVPQVTTKAEFIWCQLRITLAIMERNLEEVFREAARLPQRDRANLAGLIIAMLDPVSEPDAEAAWSEEIKRRVTEIEDGTVELIAWEEVRAELFGGRIRVSTLIDGGSNP